MSIKTLYATSISGDVTDKHCDVTTSTADIYQEFSLLPPPPFF